MILFRVGITIYATNIRKPGYGTRPFCLIAAKFSFQIFLLRNISSVLHYGAIY